jgi:hypothetical protein
MVFGVGKPLSWIRVVRRALSGMKKIDYDVFFIAFLCTYFNTHRSVIPVDFATVCGESKRYQQITCIKFCAHGYDSCVLPFQWDFNFQGKRFTTYNLFFVSSVVLFGIQSLLSADENTVQDVEPFVNLGVYSLDVTWQI